MTTELSCNQKNQIIVGVVLRVLSVSGFDPQSIVHIADQLTSLRTLPALIGKIRMQSFRHIIENKSIRATLYDFTVSAIKEDRKSMLLLLLLIEECLV